MMTVPSIHVLTESRIRNLHKQEVRNYEERIDNFKQQLMKERDKSIKVCNTNGKSISMYQYILIIRYIYICLLVSSENVTLLKSLFESVFQISCV